MTDQDEFRQAIEQAETEEREALFAEHPHLRALHSTYTEASEALTAATVAARVANNTYSAALADALGYPIGTRVRDGKSAMEVRKTKSFGTGQVHLYGARVLKNGNLGKRHDFYIGMAGGYGRAPEKVDAS